MLGDGCRKFAVTALLLFEDELPSKRSRERADEIGEGATGTYRRYEVGVWNVGEDVEPELRGEVL